MEFLTFVSITRDERLTDAELTALKEAEARRAASLAADGHLKRLWRPEGGGWRNVGLWSAADRDQLMELLATLPLYSQMEIEVIPLMGHPSDPGPYPEPHGRTPDG